VGTWGGEERESPIDSSMSLICRGPNQCMSPPKAWPPAPQVSRIWVGRAFVKELGRPIREMVTTPALWGTHRHPESEPTHTGSWKSIRTTFRLFLNTDTSGGAEDLVGALSLRMTWAVSPMRLPSFSSTSSLGMSLNRP
jgi:hypothetical protein